MNLQYFTNVQIIAQHVHHDASRCTVMHDAKDVDVHRIASSLYKR